MSKKRIIAALVAVGMAVGLAPTSHAASAKKTQIIIWDSNLLSHVNDDGTVNNATSFLHQAAANYTKLHPEITVKIVRTSDDITTSSAQFQAASIAKNGPDLKVGFTGGGTDSYSKYFVDLSRVLPKSILTDLSGLNTVRHGYNPKGKLIAIPYGAGLYNYIFYNKALVKAAGIDLSSPPKNWEDLISMAQKAKAAGQTPFILGNQQGYVGAWLVSALAGGMLGGDAFTQMYNGKLSIDNPSMVKAYKAYADLYALGLTNADAGSLPANQMANQFIAGKGDFLINGSWQDANLYTAMGDNVGQFAIPMLAGSKYPKTVGGGPNEAISLTTYSKHLAAAEAFLIYLAEPAQIDLYVKINQREASNSAHADPSVITNPLLKEQATVLKSMNNISFPFDNVMSQSLIDQFYKLNASVFLGNTTPADVVKQLEAQYKSEAAASK